MYRQMLILLVAAVSAAPARVLGEEGSAAAPAGSSAGAAVGGEVRDAIRDLRGAVRSPRQVDRVREGAPGRLMREERDRGERRSQYRERASLRR